MLTVTEAAKTIPVVPDTIRKYIRIGVGKTGEKEKLQAIQIMRGRRKEYRIKQSDLDEFKKKWLTV